MATSLTSPLFTDPHEPPTSQVCNRPAPSATRFTRALGWSPANRLSGSWVALPPAMVNAGGQLGQVVRIGPQRI